MAEARSDRKLRIWEATERSGEASQIDGASGGAAGSHADPEVPARATRRRFSARYKLKILEQADRCQEGELGALLRREGLYWSNLQTWRLATRGGNPTSPGPQEKGPQDQAQKSSQRGASRIAAREPAFEAKTGASEDHAGDPKKASEMMGISLTRSEQGEES